MGSDMQIFDRPIEAYLADDNALKVISNVESVERVKLVESLAAECDKDRESAAAAVNSALQNWDANQGAAHEAAVRRELEKKLSEISNEAMSRLSNEQRRLVRGEQKRLLGHGYVFVASDDELKLDEKQRTRLNELVRRARERGLEAAREDLTRVQMRNPQAYFAYKLAKEIEEIRNARQELGKEFYERSLSVQQRSQLQINSSDSGE